MVITIEPGIYLPNFGGVRIEDDILVTAEVVRFLAIYPVRSKNVPWTLGGNSR